MRLSKSSVLLLAVLSAAPALAGEATDLSGTYACHGTGVEGAKYEATVTLTQKGDTYLIEWKFDNGGFSGVGIRDGDALSVGWLNNGKAGVVHYTIKGTTLEGRWADGSTNGKVYTETLIRRDP